ATLTLTPVPAALNSITIAASPIVAQQVLNGNTVNLTGAAPSGGATVALSSASTATATVPPSVTVPAGQSSAAFAITAGSPATSTSVSITASYLGASQTAFLTVNPAPAPVPSITSVSPSFGVAGTSVPIVVTGTG